MDSVAFIAALMLWTLQKSFTSSESVCGSPPVVENGLITNDDENYELGKVLTYSCDYGFVSQNNRRTAECIEEDGELKWREPDILCIPRSCGDPGTVDHGQRKGHVFTFANRVEYVCDEGYRLIGRSTRYCQTSGQWSDRLPSCKVVECKAPSNPAEGKVFYNSLEYGSELKYECNKGFRLKLKEIRICDSNGEWSGQEPTCEEVTCSQAESPANGRVQVIGDGNAGTIALYTCDPGTKLVGSASSKCMESGEWIFDTPKCARPCRTPFVSNGRFGNYASSRHSSRKSFKTVYEGTVTDDGTEFVWICNGNYEAPENGERESKVVCENGDWSKDIRCVPAHCRSPPPAMQNAYIESFDDAHGGTVSYKCNHFFKLIRQSRVVCDFGTWTGNTGECRDTRCNRNHLNEIPGLVKDLEQQYVPSGYSFLPSCDGNYQRSETNHGTISCEEAQWKGNLSPCIPASCTHRAPEQEHVKPRAYQQRHGSTVQYDCDEGYYATQQGNVNCQYGVWIGNPPTCERIRNCQVPYVPNGSLGKYGRTRRTSNSFVMASLYTNVNFDEEYILKCNNGFEASGQRDGETTVVCRNGGWSPQIQCTPVKSCTGPPPQTTNATLQQHRTTHGSSVWYKCHPTHFKAESGNVTCLYGEWKGIVPICKDKKCYLNDLVEKEGVQLTNRATESGIFAAELACDEGYSRAYLPKCIKSEWQLQDNKSPCQPSPCEVHNLKNGRFQLLKVKNRINIGVIKFWKKEYFDDAEVGSKIAHGEEAFVSCDYPYIFNGKDSSENVRIHCMKGQWTPHPQCLIRNPEVTEIIDDLNPSNPLSNGNESDRNSSIASSGNIPFTEHVTVATTNDSFNGTSFIAKNISVELGMKNHTIPGAENNDSCTCTYKVNDQTLKAYVGDDLLYYESKVQNGVTVKFRCSHIGYYRFNGAKETRCLDCNWNISKFPRCTEPNDNDAIIAVPRENGNTIIIEPDGVLMIRPGTRFSVVCSTHYLYVCPEWKVTTASKIVRKDECISTTMGDRYSLSNYYEIYNARTSDSGRYECQVGGGKSHYIEVEVRDLLCPEINEDNSVIVTYSNGGKLHSSASFTCSHPDWQLVGRNRINCLQNGQWSGEPPICKYVECPLIPESNGMTIDYRPNRLVNGRAVFHCSFPLKRNGPVSISCKASGTWSGQFASCSKPMCPEIPESDSVNITYNGDRGIQSTATFQCANPAFILIGPDTIFCLSTEKWNENPPICKSSCTQPAPEQEHVKPRAYQRRHGSTVQYDCDEGYYATQQGNVNCQYGVWIGNPPTCERIRNCQVPYVPNGSLGKYGRTRRNSNSFVMASLYTNVNFDEEYILKCNNGFEASGQRDGETTVVCRNGGWFPQIQCTPAKSCTGPPPETTNATLQLHGTTHGSFVWYNCHPTHFKAESGNVTCLYGEWKGIVPICKDKKCYLNDLVEKEGVQLTNRATESGIFAAELACDEGYSRAYLPKCIKSEWQLQDNKSPCQPSPCEVHNLKNGRFQLLKVKNGINIGVIKFWKNEYFDDAEVGSKIAHGEEAFVSCDHPYIFNGKDSSESVRIHCMKGQWTPHPQCLIKPMCPEIPESDSVNITYNGDRGIQSTATFQCANPAFILIGPDTIFCLATEKWNEDAPICKYVTCSMETIYDVLPQGVVPKVENLETDTLPVGHSFNLGCDEENRFVAGTNRITCETSGRWSIAGSVKCELGCGPLKKNATSKLIIIEEKDNYNFGDSVELSCPPGEKLTEDIVRVLCLNNGWSEENIPDCKPAKT